MKKTTILGLMLLIIPALIFAQPIAKGQDEPCGKMEMKAAMNCAPMGAMPGMNMLKLTDQQKADLKKIHIKYQRLNIPLHSDLNLANLDLKEAIENLDQKKIDEAVKKLNDIKAKLFKNRIDQKIEFLKLLTDEQKKMLKDRPCRMQNMKRMPGQGRCEDMGCSETDEDIAFGFGADLPTDIIETETED